MLCVAVAHIQITWIALRDTASPAKTGSHGRATTLRVVWSLGRLQGVPRKYETQLYIRAMHMSATSRALGHLRLSRSRAGLGDVAPSGIRHMAGLQHPGRPRAAFLSPHGLWEVRRCEVRDVGGGGVWRHVWIGR